MTTEEQNRQGIVVKKMLGKYTVRSANRRPIDCTLAGNLTKQLMYSIADPSSMPKRVLKVKEIESVDPVAVGDEVIFDLAADGSSAASSGVITAIQPRKNKLSRPVTDGARIAKQRGAREQVIVANIDQIVVVMPAANPPPAWNLLDRYLATAEACNIPALICFTKADLLDADLSQEVALYREIGYRVILTSAVSGLGLAEVKAALHDRVSVLWGKSGVGKTSLLNAIEPGLGLRVKAVNDHTSEGRHTTTHLEMFDLSFGGSVIDTPGQRAFKLYDEIADYAELLPEMRDFIGRCKFGLDCTHMREPGCAIKSAVSQGVITSRRYESFLGMKEYFGS